MSTHDTVSMTALPHVGRPLPAFSLPSTQREIIRVRAFKQRQPVLLCFLHSASCPSCRRWLQQFMQLRDSVAELHPALLVVIPSSIEDLRTDQQYQGDIPYTVLADVGSHVTAMYTCGDRRADTESCTSHVALYVADRYGYTLARWLADDADGLPSPEDALVAIDDAEQEDCGCGLAIWEGMTPSYLGE